MIITVIGEARSGTYSLHKWMSMAYPNFNCYFEPFNTKTESFNKEIVNFNWVNDGSNYIISDKYIPHHTYNSDSEILIEKLIDVSDVVFYLIRENENEQLESMAFAFDSGNWFKEYEVNDLSTKKLKLKYPYLTKQFFDNKQIMKDFMKKHPLKTFTYEQLYQNNGIEELKEYIGLPTELTFPINKKYRKNSKKVFLI